MDSVDVGKIETFVHQMLQAYNHTALLDSIASVISFNPEIHEQLELSQIGKRTGIPRRFFFTNDNVDNSMVAADFARAIVAGERNFFLHEIEKSSVVVNISGFTYESILNVMRTIDNPTDMFIPIEPFFNNFYTWNKPNHERIRFEYMKEPILLAGNQEIRVHWLTTDTGFTEIFITNRKGISLARKEFKDASTPKDFDIIPEMNYISPKEKLMVYFGKSKKTADDFDLVIRTIVSNPVVNPNAALKISVDS
ncbi:MAG: hypothetical protein HYS81_01345 [Candidatus Aenigmatarchaeota archaeon]|nr:MAG: hypothetical protein HYS81_01345 [Candidatus Aenigmarchaeota archaeon]